MSKYYKTTFTVTVLSQEPVQDGMSLSDVDYYISSGDGVGQVNKKEEELTGKQAAEALNELGSEPAFFGLDDNGNETED